MGRVQFSALSLEWEKTSAAMVFIKEYLRIVERVHLISSTLHLDKGYEEIMGMIKKKYQEEDIDIDEESFVFGFNINTLLLLFGVFDGVLDEDIDYYYIMRN